MPEAEPHGSSSFGGLNCDTINLGSLENEQGPWGRLPLPDPTASQGTSPLGPPEPQGPGTRDQGTGSGPGTRDQGPVTRGQGPGTRDQGPGPGPGTGTRDQGPGTRDQGPGTRDQGRGPGTRDRDQGPGYRKGLQCLRYIGRRTVRSNLVFAHLVFINIH